jgi:CubicO group peptidase (beta-lactamase class C family)
MNVFLLLVLAISLFGCSSNSTKSLQQTAGIGADELSRKPTGLGEAAPIAESLRPEILAAIQTKFKATGGMATVLAGGKLYSSTYGSVDYEKTRDIDSTTYFRMGSVSKILTAAGILKLVEQGKINLNDPLRKYLPWFKVKGFEKLSDKITIKHLLAHTSGISREFGCPFSAENGEWLRIPSDRSCVMNQEIHFEPGTEVKYSNLGFNLLGQVIDRVFSGQVASNRKLQAFADFMTKSILKPLGMPTAKYFLSQSELDRAAKPLGIILPGKELREPVAISASAYENTPSYYMALTIQDFPALLNFLRKIAKNEDSIILRAETQRKMLDMRLKDKFTNYEYGLGLTVVEGDAGRIMIGHSGGAPGYRNFVMYDMQSDVGIAVSANTHDQAAREVANILFKQYSPTGLGSIPQVDTSEGVAESEKVDHAINGDYYDWARKMTFAVVNNKPGSLTVDIMYDGKRRRMTTVSEEKLQFRIPLAGPYSDAKGEIIEFKKSSNGTISTLIMSRAYLFTKY